MDTKTKYDYTVVAPTVQSLVATSTGFKLDPSSALDLYMKHPDLFNKIFGFIGGALGPLIGKLLNRGKKDKQDPLPVPAPPPSGPVILDPPVVKPPVTPGTGATIGVGIVKRLALAGNGIYHFQEWTNGPGTGRLVDKKRYDEILGGNAVGRGCKIKGNVNPYDADGNEIRTDDERLSRINGGLPFIEVQGEFDGQQSDWIGYSTNGGMVGPIEVHGYGNDDGGENWGCTTGWKVPRDYSQGRKSFRWRSRVIGTQVMTDWTPMIFIAG